MLLRKRCDSLFLLCFALLTLLWSETRVQIKVWSETKVSDQTLI